MSVARQVWEFIREQGPRGAIADEVLQQFPALGHTTVTARIHGLKAVGLITRHPEKRVRKTRKGRTAEVWVVPHGTVFDTSRYEKRVRPSEPRTAPCSRPHVTEAELELLALARAYGEMNSENEHKVDGAISALFDKIVKVYPQKGPR